MSPESLENEKLKYTPVDYNTWNSNGQGDNIRDKLNHSEVAIWQAALPFQDTRNDTGHVEMVVFFVDRLMRYCGGEREVVIPAAIFHDTGYNITPEEFRYAFQGEGKNDFQLQRKIRLEHQVIATVRAFDILRKVRYPAEYIGEILRIIVDHDTRIADTNPSLQNPSINGKIVMDADILWRFTKPCMEAYESGRSCKEKLESMEKQELSKPDRFYFPVSRQIARIEMANTLLALHPEEAKKLFKHS